MLRPFFLMFVVGSVVAVSGCMPESSSSIATDALHVSYQVVQEGDVVRVRADFRVGNALGTTLTLADGDEIRVNGTALAYEAFLIPHYEGTVMPSAQYDFVFTRPGEGSFTSSTIAPAPVTITSPSSGATVSRGNGFTATWTDPDATGDYFIGVSGVSDSCSANVSTFVDDATTFAFTPEMFREPVETEDGEEDTGETQPVCEGQTLTGQFSVESSTNGTMATELKGSIRGITNSSVSVTLAP